MRLQAKGGEIYRLKVTLERTKPAIWRRFLVPSDVSLQRLHGVLQIVMGWTDSHLHQFVAGKVVYGTPDREFGIECESERRTILNQVLRKPGDKMAYEYDFGDGWRHDIVLEAVLPANPDTLYPQVEAGKGACPPEDVGGIGGYYRFLDVIADAKHAEHDQMLEWVGGAFDPEAFSIADLNRAFHGKRSAPKSGA